MRRGSFADSGYGAPSPYGGDRRSPWRDDYGPRGGYGGDRGYGDRGSMDRGPPVDYGAYDRGYGGGGGGAYDRYDRGGYDRGSADYRGGADYRDRDRSIDRRAFDRGSMGVRDYDRGDRGYGGRDFAPPEDRRGSYRGMSESPRGRGRGGGRGRGRGRGKKMPPRPMNNRSVLTQWVRFNNHRHPHYDIKWVLRKKGTKGDEGIIKISAPMMCTVCEQREHRNPCRRKKGGHRMSDVKQGNKERSGAKEGEKEEEKEEKKEEKKEGTEKKEGEEAKEEETEEKDKAENDAKNVEESGAGDDDDGENDDDDAGARSQSKEPSTKAGTPSKRRFYVNDGVPTPGDDEELQFFACLLEPLHTAWTVDPAPTRALARDFAAVELLNFVAPELVIPRERVEAQERREKQKASETPKRKASVAPEEPPAKRSRPNGDGEGSQGGEGAKDDKKEEDKKEEVKKEEGEKTDVAPKETTEAMEEAK